MPSQIATICMTLWDFFLSLFLYFFLSLCVFCLFFYPCSNINDPLIVVKIRLRAVYCNLD